MRGKEGKKLGEDAREKRKINAFDRVYQKLQDTTKQRMERGTWEKKSGFEGK